MPSQPFNKEFIQDLAKMLSDCDLTEIEIEHDKSKLRVAREIKQNVYAPMPTASIPLATAPQVSAPAPIAPQASTNSASVEEIGEKITSPMVGTVYLAPDPDSAPFVKVGDKVDRGQTIMIVEAMKVMNNIPSPKAGIVKAIKVNDKEPVEFDQVLAIIE